MSRTKPEFHSDRGFRLGLCIGAVALATEMKSANFSAFLDQLKTCPVDRHTYGSGTRDKLGVRLKSLTSHEASPLIIAFAGRGLEVRRYAIPALSWPAQNTAASLLRSTIPVCGRANTDHIYVHTWLSEFFCNSAITGSVLFNTERIRNRLLTWLRPQWRRRHVWSDGDKSPT